MDSPNIDLKLEEILLNTNFAKFGDSIVNFVYNAAVYETKQKLQGIKVWDKSLAEACRNSPLRSYLGSKKNSGDLGDAVEAFLSFVYIKNKNSIYDMIKILSKSLREKWDLSDKTEQVICGEAFTYLINQMCDELEILPKQKT
ncbi:MAG: ribonuclease III family protein [Candidatus Thorarchaeota archaeon]